MSDGIECKCAARSTYECSCEDVDWRSAREVELEQQLAAIQAALPDDFSEAKDWTFSNGLVARIEWLKAMYLNRKRDSEEAFAQLAAAQADNLRLREALERLACLGNGDEYGNSTGNVLALKALATPTGDLSALREFSARLLEEIAQGEPELLCNVAEMIRHNEMTPEVLK